MFLKFMYILNKNFLAQPNCFNHVTNTRFYFKECGHEVQNRGFAIPKIYGGSNVRSQLNVSSMFRSWTS